MGGGGVGKRAALGIQVGDFRPKDIHLPMVLL